MKQGFYILLFFVILASGFRVAAQQRCGTDELKKVLFDQHPGLKEAFEARQAANIAEALAAKKNNGAARISATNDIVIPVVFHIIVNEGQYQQMGGKWGIETRCRTQIDVLNEDFNSLNADSSLIPSSWKPLFANVGIHFALAHTDPNGYPSPGYTIRLTSSQGFCCMSNSFDSAKYTDYGGTDAWDVTKYVNVWCINFNDGYYDGLLGITLPISMTTPGSNTNQAGVCITYNSLGRRTSDSDSYPLNTSDGNYYDRGRTLTHEMGHVFEIWHVWGDDGGLCPWEPTGRSVLPDIPPQGDHTLTNPVYTIAGGTVHDNCADSSGVPKQPIGIACLDYLDYTDDQGMHLFTPDQAAVMIAQLNDSTGENYSLTQHPEVLNWPPGSPQIMGFYPNPTTGIVNIYYDNNNDVLQQVAVFDLVGRCLKSYQTSVAGDHVTINLSGLIGGVYLLKCKFANSSYAQKITIER